MVDVLDMLPLKDKWIVVTRPKDQAKNLKHKLESAGANVILFPLQEITPPDNLALIKKQLLRLDDYDLAIFISANAVKYTFEYINIDELSSLKIAAIGKKTRHSLDNHGITVNYYPDGISNSEALLSMPDMLEFTKGKKVVILRGNGGRELIRDTLLERAKTVDYIEVYKREFPHTDLTLLNEYHHRNELDIILISSGQSLTNLFHFSANNTWLKKVSLLLGSHRIKQQASELTENLGELLSTQDPSDDAVFERLLEWGKRETSNG